MRQWDQEWKILARLLSAVPNFQPGSEGEGIHIQILGRDPASQYFDVGFIPFKSHRELSFWTFTGIVITVVDSPAARRFLFFFVKVELLIFLSSGNLAKTGELVVGP